MQQLATDIGKHPPTADQQKALTATQTALEAALKQKATQAAAQAASAVAKIGDALAPNPLVPLAAGPASTDPAAIRPALAAAWPA